MQADTGTKMIHLGKNTRSTIVSKGISADQSHNTYRGLVKFAPRATGARNYTQCDSIACWRSVFSKHISVIETTGDTGQIETRSFDL